MPYPIELFQCGHGIAIAPAPPPPPPTRTGRIGRGGARRTVLAGEMSLDVAQRKGWRGGVVLESLWPFVAAAEGLAEVEWEDGERYDWPPFVFARGSCRREGCRGGGDIEGGEWESVGVYDEDDMRDLEGLRECVRAAELEAVAAAAAAARQYVREDGARVEERRTQEVGRKGKNGVDRRPRSHRIKIFSTHRGESFRLCSSVRDNERSHGASRVVGLHQHPRVTRKEEGQKPRQVMALKQIQHSPPYSRRHRLSGAGCVTGHPVLPQLLMIGMCLEQAEMLADMRAPKGWFEACLWHVLEELEDAEGTMLAHDSL